MRADSEESEGLDDVDSSDDKVALRSPTTDQEKAAEVHSLVISGQKKFSSSTACPGFHGA